MVQTLYTCGIDKFNARKMARNFTIEEYIQAIEYAHLRGVKIYLTLNVLLNDDEIKEAMEILIKLYSHGLDAVIIQDIGLIDVIKNVLPKLDIHISTQMTVHNLNQVKYLEKLGVSRIVLARELSIEEIKYICDNTNLEIEVFVHGALCMSYSGACLMSSMIGDRSGNKGACAATCRMKYTLSKNGNKLKSGHLLSKKDIYGLEHISKLIDAGVSSLKIEGRGKTLEYVGLITDKYKQAVLNKENNNIDEKEILQMFNREGKSYGYLTGVLKEESISINTAKNTGLYLGKILDVKNKFVKVKLNEDINLHDGIEIYDENNKVVYSSIITCIKDEKLNIVNNICSKNQTVYLGDINIKLNNNSVYKINKTSCRKLNVRYKKKIDETLRKVLVPIEINIIKDSIIIVNVMNETLEFNYVPETAIKKQVDYVYVSEALSKTGNSPFEFEIVDFNIDDNLFIPVSKLNELRRYIVNYLINKNKINIDVEENYKLLNEHIKKHNLYLKANENIENNNLNEYIYLYKFNNNIDYSKFTEKTIAVEICDILKNEEIIFNINKNINICIPAIVNANLNKYILNNLERIVKQYNIKKIIIGNFGYLELCNKIKKENKELKLVADYNLNIVNTYSAKHYKQNNIDYICLGNEIEEHMIDKIANVINIELLQNYITVMTTRFCIISSFTNKCDCTSNELYTLKDDYEAKYYIISDNTDCITKLVKQYNNEQIVKYRNKATIRKNSLFG